MSMYNVARRVAAVIVVFALFASSSSVDAETLWRGAQYGMTVAQVLAAVPAAVIHEPKAGEHLSNGAEELVRGPIQEIVNKSFLPKFYFSEGKLVQVTLSLQDDEKAYAANLTFDSLEVALRAKYGQELSEKRAGIIRQSQWLSGVTNISLYMIVIGDNPALMNIVYQQRVSQDASKL